MPDRDRILQGLQICLPETSIDGWNDCSLCQYRNDCGADNVSLPVRMVEDIRTLLKEQEEREKVICKGICDFIRGSCSTDTYEDKEYVCHVIQQMFIKGRSVK